MSHIFDAAWVSFFGLPEGTVLSRAHDWRSHSDTKRDATSWKSKHMVSCMRCGAETVIGQWDVHRCHPHLESASSGFLDESDQAGLQA